MFSPARSARVRSPRSYRRATVVAVLALGLSAAGNTAASASTRPMAPQVAAAVASTTTLVPSSSVVRFGQPLRTAVRITPTGTNGGTVTLLAGTRVLTSGPVSNGAASLVIPGSLPVGRSAITAKFSGVGSVAPSTGVKAIDIVKSSPRFDIVLSSATISRTSQARVTVALTAAGATPTGSVKVLVNGIARTSASLTNGRRVLTLPVLPPGVHSVTAVYSGDKNFVSRTSPAVRLTVTTPSTTVITPQKSAVPYGAPLPVTVKVTSPGWTPTGTVNLKAGTNAVGAANLSGGTARFTVPAGRNPGRYTLHAAAGTKAPALPSSGAKAIDVVKARPTGGVTLAAAVINNNTQGRATIALGGGPIRPSGTVKFLVDGTAVASASLADGRATVTLPKLGSGAHSVAVSYSGDVRYLARTTGAVRLEVRAPATNPCSPSARACVDLTNDRAWIQSGGQIVYGPVPITSGRPGYRTNAGIFSVYWKHIDHKSSIFNDAPMPYSIFFDGGIAFHEGSVYVWSHGCIHLSWEAARYFWDALDYGDQVHVFGYAPY